MLDQEAVCESVESVMFCVRLLTNIDTIVIASVSSIDGSAEGKLVILTN